MGTYLIEGTSLTDRVIDYALAAGYRFFDTALMYGNETYLGNAFEKLLVKYKLTREDIFITTKFVLSTQYNSEADYHKLIERSNVNSDLSKNKIIGKIICLLWLKKQFSMGRALDFDLVHEDMEEIDKINANDRFDWDPNTIS